MGGFQRLWSRIFSIISTAILSMYTFNVIVLENWSLRVVIAVPVVIAIWGIVWEFRARNKHTFAVGSKKYIDYFVKWYSRGGDLLLCVTALSWVVVEKAGVIDARIFNALTDDKKRMDPNSHLTIITEKKDDLQLIELGKKLSPEHKISVFIVGDGRLKEFAFSRWKPIEGQAKYTVKFLKEDVNAHNAYYLTNHTDGREGGLIDNLIEVACIDENRYTFDQDKACWVKSQQD